MNLTYILIFLVGMLSQSFLMLSGKWKEGDIKNILISFLSGFLGMLPGKNEHNYDLRFHLLISCVISVFAFTATFSNRLISCVGARTLIVLNVILFFVMQNNFGLSWPVFCMLLVPSLLTLINGFTDIDKNLGWQIFFYSWFLVMIVLIALVHFAFSDFINIFGWGGKTTNISYFEVFLIGSAFLYIVSNFWFVIQLIPIPGKRQSFSSRMIEVRKHMQLLAYGYVWQSGDFLGNILVIIILPACMYLNSNFKFVDENVFISFVLAFLPLINKFNSTDIANRDGVGFALVN